FHCIHALAGTSLLKILKRWPFMISNCVLSLTENLCNSDTSEHIVLGSCSILATQTVLKHLTLDLIFFSAFLLSILTSSHHESLKPQKAINELFVKYIIQFAGLSRGIFRKSGNHLDELEFSDLVSPIASLSFDTSGLYWWYNLMANRVLLLLTMASRSDPTVN
ncbi:hypothetical protein MKX01_041253, partial [Papaver californicum]